MARRLPCALLVFCCLAAGPASQPATAPSEDGPPTQRLREGKITVDAKDGPDLLLEVKKGDVYVFTAKGKWSHGGDKPFGPEGVPIGNTIDGSNRVYPTRDRQDFLKAHFSADLDVNNFVKIGANSKWKADDDGVLRLDALGGEKSTGKIVVTFRRTAGQN